MCGFAGYLNFDTVFAQKEIIQSMLDAIRHRGPDDRGCLIRGQLGLGHVRLSILDTSTQGHQPMWTHDEKGVLVYNGEIYNYLELKKDLMGQNVVFKSATDTEVLLYALHLWGPEVVIKRLNGMFGFAYFDFRTETLWLARDRTGIKPLYLAKTCRGYVFGSEIKALLRHPDVHCEPDIVTLATHITQEYFEDTWSPFAGIDTVLPGTLIRISQSSMKTITYYDTLEQFNVENYLSSRNWTDHTAADLLENALRKSVHAHMMSDVPVATFCSGGVDSSLVTAYAREKDSSIVAYVARCEDAFPEYKRAQLVGKQLGVEIREVPYSLKDYLYDWPESIWHNDVPPCYRCDQAFIAVANACRKDGIKVVLTGEGADELLGGYEWQAAAYHMWKSARSRMPFLNKIIQSLDSRGFFSPFYTLSTKVREERTFARYPTPEPYYKYQVLRRACCEDGANRTYRYKALLEKLEPINPMKERAFTAVCLNDMYGHISNLLHRNDRMGMAASVESRVPFLENNLINYSLHLPSFYKYRKKTSKWLLKKVALQHLPAEVVNAPKIGFSTSTQPYQCVLPLLRGGMVSQMFKWNPRVENDLLEDLKANPYVLYTVAGVELWARVFIGKEDPSSLGETLVEIGRKNNIIR